MNYRYPLEMILMLIVVVCGLMGMVWLAGDVLDLGNYNYNQEAILGFCQTHGYQDFIKYEAKSGNFLGVCYLPLNSEARKREFFCKTEGDFWQSYRVKECYFEETTQ